MSITEEKIDQLNSVLKIVIEEQTYRNQVEKALKEYSKNAVVKGFRPGKAPAKMLEKMYGKKIKAEEIDKLVSKELSQYLIDNNLPVLGQPMPSQDQKVIDLNAPGDFEFRFDIGKAPEIDLKLDKSISVPYYKIIVPEEEIDKTIESYQQKFGKAVEKEISEENSYVRGLIEETDENGNVIKNGIISESTFLAIDLIKDTEIKNKFIGISVNQVINFDVKKAFENETEISSMLKIDKTLVADMNPHFQISIESITTFEKLEIGTELFEKTYGKEIETIEQYREKVKESIEKMYKADSDYIVNIDIRKELLKTISIPLPDQFLKRWLKFSDDEGKITDEIIEKDYPAMTQELKWDLISSEIIKNADLKVVEEEIYEQAVEETIMQFRQYGMQMEQLPKHIFDNFVNEQLAKPESKKKFAKSAINKKMFDYTKDQIDLQLKDIAYDELVKMFRAGNDTETGAEN